MTKSDERTSKIPEAAVEAVEMGPEDEACDWPCPDCKAIGWQK